MLIKETNWLNIKNLFFFLYNNKYKTEVQSLSDQALCANSELKITAKLKDKIMRLAAKYNHNC